MAVMTFVSSLPIRKVCLSVFYSDFINYWGLLIPNYSGFIYLLEYALALYALDFIHYWGLKTSQVHINAWAGLFYMHLLVFKRGYFVINNH